MKEFLKENLPIIMEIIEFEKDDREMQNLYNDYGNALKTNAMNALLYEQKIRDHIKSYRVIKALCDKPKEMTGGIANV